jgi:4'-phosphopantetheinyl transferase
VVCAFGLSVVGVDIELVRPIDIRLVKRVCTANEYEYVLGSHMQEFGMITDVDVLRRFFEIWTLKEAYFKALGTGITNFKSVDVLASERERCTYYSDGYLISVIYA